MDDESYEIVTDKDKLTSPCKEVTLSEGKKIGKVLLRELKNSENGVGLAANQIGIDGRVCVVNVGRQVVLVNPVIKNSFKKIFFPEACLSFPGEQVITERYANIIVKADNHDRDLYFTEDNLLECVCVQHEIDHLNGITMFDRQVSLDKIDKLKYTNDRSF